MPVWHRTVCWYVMPSGFVDADLGPGADQAVADRGQWWEVTFVEFDSLLAGVRIGEKPLDLIVFGRELGESFR